MRPTSFIFFGLLLLLSYQGNSQGMLKSNETVHAAIEQMYKDLKKAMQDGDSRLVATNMYTEDAALYNPDGGVAKGREELEKAFAGMIGSGVVIECHPIEVEASGNMAYEIGSASIQNKEGKELTKTPYMVIWKQENGDWKMYRDFVQGK